MSVFMGGPTTGFKEVPGQHPVFVTGVGFWAFCGGVHIPHGAAPNSIELHPVLDVNPRNGTFGGSVREDLFSMREYELQLIKNERAEVSA